MKRRTKKTFFELKVTFYFDLFQFFIGGYYDHINKAVHFALIPTLIIKLESAKDIIKGKVVVTLENAKAAEGKWPTEEAAKSIKKAGKELLKHGKKAKK